MHIGVPQEIKNHEYRVGLTPDSVRALCAHGHAVSVQRGAGAAIGLGDAAYAEAGALLLPDAASVFAQADIWIGAAIGAAMIFGAIHFRRSRDEG